MNKNTIIWALVIVVAVSSLVWLVRMPAKPGKLDSFASCISASGAKFYGAFWCPHCQNQKAMFGSSAKLLPYIECSTPDGKSQLPICKDAGVEGYPTWEFGTSTRESGELSLARLSELTSCPLPQE